MTNIRNALMQAAGTAASGDPVYVEDVFSTHLFTGTQSTLAINNGIDLDDKGGLVWFKARNNARNHALFDTARGNNLLYSSTDAAQSATTTAVTATNSNGFTVGSDTQVNKSGETIAAWTFAKQEGFFDVVTYTGDGNTSQTINHNLGCKPGMIIIKLLDSPGYDWPVWHKSLGANYIVRLNLTAATNNGATSGGNWNSTAPTSTQFTVGSYGQVNNNGSNFIAYLFADGDESAAQIFGDGADEAIVKCGTFTTSSTWGIANAECGFEPQFVMYKRTDSTGDWFIVDNMRGCATKQGKWNGVDDGTQYSSVSASNDQVLRANTSATEAEEGRADFYATGFAVAPGIGNAEFIYMAIRRGPMKEPSAGTDVYNAVTFTGTGSAADIDSGFPVDLAIPQKRTANQYYNFRDRLRGNKQTLQLPLSGAQYSNASLTCEFDDMNGFHHAGSNIDTGYAANGQSSIAYMFRRYPKVFDVVAYGGTGSAHAEAHNLGAVPELLICKTTTFSNGWFVTSPSLGLTSGTYPNTTRLDSTTGLISGGTNYFSQQSTATNFYPTGTNNVSGQNYIAYLFGTLSGVSKVGSYTGTGNDINVTDLGAAARFVLIKRVNDGYSGDAYVYDSARGIVAGNDIYSLWNSTSAEVTNTDYIDPHASGFTITSSAPDGLNASGGTYLYLAFA